MAVFLNTKLNICCCNCPFNDGLMYTSNPVQFRCTKTGEWHNADYVCGKLHISYVKDKEN